LKRTLRRGAVRQDFHSVAAVQQGAAAAVEVHPNGGVVLGEIVDEAAGLKPGREPHPHPVALAQVLPVRVRVHPPERLVIDMSVAVPGHDCPTISQEIRSVVPA